MKGGSTFENVTDEMEKRAWKRDLFLHLYKENKSHLYMEVDLDRAYADLMTIEIIKQMPDREEIDKILKYAHRIFNKIINGDYYIAYRGAWYL